MKRTLGAMVACALAISILSCGRAVPNYQLFEDSNGLYYVFQNQQIKAVKTATVSILVRSGWDVVDWWGGTENEPDQDGTIKAVRHGTTERVGIRISTHYPMNVEVLVGGDVDGPRWGKERARKFGKMFFGKLAKALK